MLYKLTEHIFFLVTYYNIDRSMWLTVCVTCNLSNLLFIWLAICVRLCDSLSVSIYYDLNTYPSCYLTETIVLTKSPVKDHSCPEGGQYRAVQSLALSCRVLFHQFILGCLTSPVLYQLNFVLPLISCLNSFCTTLFYLHKSSTGYIVI